MFSPAHLPESRKLNTQLEYSIEEEDDTAILRNKIQVYRAKMAECTGMMYIGCPHLQDVGPELQPAEGSSFSFTTGHGPPILSFHLKTPDNCCACGRSRPSYAISAASRVLL
ncbi:hypothetical protein AVEN_239116-1 [Araneus ventricosus]|uniref:Uncharacterized protein n=1 Tax=Araneus ventricosus TaxID=182803 RepID=A0A4Y2Q7Y7_ARAVE|nr:hypothetical protein AVEN_239116-1 [Araneus ventricosus]